MYYALNHRVLPKNLQYQLLSRIVCIYGECSSVIDKVSLCCCCHCPETENAVVSQKSFLLLAVSCHPENELWQKRSTEWHSQCRFWAHLREAFDLITAQLSGLLYLLLMKTVVEFSASAFTYHRNEHCLCLAKLVRHSELRV